MLVSLLIYDLLFHIGPRMQASSTAASPKEPLNLYENISSTTLYPTSNAPLHHKASRLRPLTRKPWPLFRLECKPKAPRFNLISNKKQGTRGTGLATTAQHHKQRGPRGGCRAEKPILQLQVSKCGALFGILHLACQISPSA